METGRSAVLRRSSFSLRYGRYHLPLPGKTEAQLGGRHIAQHSVGNLRGDSQVLYGIGSEFGDRPTPVDVFSLWSITTRHSQA